MKKSYLIMAAAAALFAACSSENDVVQSPVIDETIADNSAVVFDSYINRSTTRSGESGTITTSTENTRTLQSTGFGVFGYYTDDNEYDGQTLPNFMYNEKITYSTTNKYWSYDPVKYWPNEYGSSAIADDADKVSFFAYAPYVEVTPNTGKASDMTYGITQLSRNSATGDPYVKYIASFDWSNNVDLIWGVCDDPSWNVVSGENQQINKGAKGLPWLNVERPKSAAVLGESSGQKVKFTFKHALAKLNVQVDYDADQDSHSDTGNELDATTRVYVRSVTFTGFSMRGALNLNNLEPSTPLWMAYDAYNDLESGEETTIYDGRKDGKEGSSSAIASNEKNSFINPALIQTTAWNSDNKGVRNKPQNLFFFPGAEKVTADMLKGASATTKVALTDEENLAYGKGPSSERQYTAESKKGDVPEGGTGDLMRNWPVMVIPNGDELTITIVYDIETVDSKLATTVSDNSTKGSSIENRITKTITFQGARNYMEAGKLYTVKLHLGLNSVKFDATVTGWETTPIEGENWFPANTTTFQAPGVYDYTVAAATTTTDEFTLTGFSPNEAITSTASTGLAGLAVTPATPGNADSKGDFAVTKLSWTNANTSVLNTTTSNAVKFTGITSGKELTLNLIQLAAQPDNNSTLTIGTGTKYGTFALSNGTALTGAKWSGASRNVTIISAYRNGKRMTELDEANAELTGATALQFCTDSTDADAGKIWLGTAAQAGEVFTFTIKAGDSGEVTITCTVS